MYGSSIISVHRIVTVIAEKLKLALFVDAGVSNEVISVDGLKVEGIRAAAKAGEAVIAPLLAVTFNISDILSVGDSGNNEERVLAFAELVDFGGIGSGHLPLDLHMEIAAYSSVYIMEQKVWQIVLPVIEHIPLRLILPSDAAGIKEHAPSRLQS